jgi:hypothetical protein
MQLLEDDDADKDHGLKFFHVFKRWGRVGYSGGFFRQSLQRFDSADEGMFIRLPGLLPFFDFIP